MLKLLLDTHILLWSLLEPDKLGSKTTKLLEDLNNELWLSPISLWEIIILAEKGKITLDMAPQEWIETVLKSIPFREAPLNFNVALASRSISLPHQDPADRFLAGTAKIYNLTLVTADRHLLTCKDIHLMKNE